MAARAHKNTHTPTTATRSMVLVKPAGMSLAYFGVMVLGERRVGCSLYDSSYRWCRTSETATSPSPIQGVLLYEQAMYPIGDGQPQRTRTPGAGSLLNCSRGAIRLYIGLQDLVEMDWRANNSPVRGLRSLFHRSSNAGVVLVVRCWQPSSIWFPTRSLSNPCPQ